MELQSQNLFCVFISICIYHSAFSWFKFGPPTILHRARDKGAFIEEAIYLGDDQLDALVDIKSREELIGDIISLLQSPAKNVVSALQSGGGKLSGILKTLSEKEG